jgi:carbon monoxide dehydrogenase subunit G
VPTTRRSRTITASAEDVWTVVADAHHLARWWPRVTRVEAVDEDAFTLVLATNKGRGVRADYRVIASEAPRLRSWMQQVAGTPFEGILALSRTDVKLEPAGDGTRVTISVRQKMRSFARLGGMLVRRAARKQLDEALDGLEAVVGR